jgi:hypothetical protein
VGRVEQISIHVAFGHYGISGRHVRAGRETDADVALRTSAGPERHLGNVAAILRGLRDHSMHDSFKA